MPVQSVREIPYDFVSHTLSKQVTRWGEWSKNYLPSSSEPVSLVFCQNFDVDNGSQEPCIKIKFDSSQTGQMEGPSFGVPFSNRDHPWN